jgi:mono/diheme cytochrome c family protein
VQRCLIFLVLCACARTAPAEATPAVEPPTPVAKLMGKHFLRAREAMDLIIAGDLETTRAALAEVRDHHVPDVPDAWVPMLADVRATADEGAAATNIGEAVAAVARLAEACGACHTRHGGGPIPEEMLLPPLDGMARHRWTTDMMWLGLLTPSDLAWRAGASELASRGVSPGSQPIEEERLARWRPVVEKAATAAVEAEVPARRADALAEVMAACAGCHRDR